MHPTTAIVQGAVCGPPDATPTSIPIYQTATFAQSSADADDQYDYSRSGNPTRAALETQLAALEHGTHAFAFTSGMAAIHAVTQLAGAGDEIVAGTDLYGGTYRLLAQVASGYGVTVRFVDTSCVAGVVDAITPRTKLVLIETPTNPRQRIADIAAIADAARRAGVVLAVDNTMLSPYLQRPLTLGADLVIHSATKHLGGHGDVTAGAVITGRADLAERLAFIQNATGAALAPFDAWLLLRGIKTLALRLDRQQATAARLADRLAAHPRLGRFGRVFQPALAGHPGRALHFRQADGPGSVVAFTTGAPAVSRRIVDNVRLFAISVSFGGVASSISLPCRMSHASIPVDVRAARALPEDLVRLSVGIEDASDLEADLLGAIDAAFAAGDRAARPAAVRTPAGLLHSAP